MAVGSISLLCILLVRQASESRQMPDPIPLTTLPGQEYGASFSPDGNHVVFPRADVKIYLDADPAERARRRANDPAHTGGPTAVAEVATMLTARDDIDRTRSVSPLYAAPDAVIVDTTSKSIDEVVGEVLEMIKKYDVRSTI